MKSLTEKIKLPNNLKTRYRKLKRGTYILIFNKDLPQETLNIIAKNIEGITPKDTHIIITCNAKLIRIK